MSEIADAMRAEASPLCEARGGFGNRIRRMQRLLMQAADQLDVATEEEVRAAFRAAIPAGKGGQKVFAMTIGLAQSVVSEVASGRRPVPESIANALGYVETPKRYRRIAKGREA